MTPNSPLILVVDDNRDACDSFAELLALKGFDTHYAYGGARALATAATCRPDVVFLDIDMPEVDGYLVVSAMRDLLASRAYIVALTARDDPETLAHIVAAGFDECIVKPTAYKAIMSVIDRNRLPLAA